MSDYDKACLRLGRAASTKKEASEAYSAAAREFDEALAALADYEEKPGVPLPQYQPAAG